VLCLAAQFWIAPTNRANDHVSGTSGPGVAVKSVQALLEEKI
jgi:hypothetical protein